MASSASINRQGTTLSITELEDGLRILQTDVGGQFWEENVGPFRQTVLAAIHETSDALASPDIPLRWRVELERQLKALRGYVQLADDHLARQARGSTIN